MKRYIRLTFFAAAFLFVFSVLPVSVFSYNEEDGPAGVIHIRTADDLLRMKEHPCADYVLVNDIDMKGIPWQPFVFSGTLDGRGHAVMNVKVESGFAQEREYTAMDGTVRSARCTGFFSSVYKAQIFDLQLLGISLNVTSDSDSFTGVLSGHAVDSTVFNCIISGSVYVKSGAGTTGAGGVFGCAENSSVRNCDVSAVICVSGKSREHTSAVITGGLLAFGNCSCVDNIVTVAVSALADGDLYMGGAAGFSRIGTGTVSFTNNRITGTVTYRNIKEDGKVLRNSVTGKYEGGYSSYRNRDFLVFRSVQDGRFVPGPHEGCPDPHEFTLKVDPRPGRAGYEIDLCENCGYAAKHDYTAPLEGTYINPARPDWQDNGPGQTDILVFAAHADDDQLFFAGMLTYYALIRDLNVQVLYGTDHYSQRGRHTERELGLWGVGITNRPESSGWHDSYSESISEAVSQLKTTDGKDLNDVAAWYREMILKYRPQVVITHDIYGEYGHGQHRLLAGGLQLCLERYADEFDFLRKAYLHSGSSRTVKVDAIDTRFGELNGRTPFTVAQDFGYAEHYSQQASRHTVWLYGNRRQIRRAGDIQSYSPLYWSLIWGDETLDEHGNDIFEGLTSYAEQERMKREEEERILREEEEKRLGEEKRIREEKEAAERKVTEDRAYTVIWVSGVILAGVFITDIVLILRKKKKRKLRKKK